MVDILHWITDAEGWLGVCFRGAYVMVFFFGVTGLISTYLNRRADVRIKEAEAKIAEANRTGEWQDFRGN